MSAALMRNPAHVVVTTGDAVLFAAPDAPLCTIPTEAPEAWSAWLQRLCAPTPAAGLADAPDAPPELDAALIERLVAEGHLLRADAAALERRLCETMERSPAFSFAPRPRACEGLLVGCCGSVVAGLVPQTLLSLRYTGFQGRLDAILTASARRFLAPDLLEAYGIRTFTDAFERRDEIRVPHVDLPRGADAIVVLPATANAMARIAQGACSDLLSLCVAAASAPTLLIPAMNQTMWEDPAIRRNAARLRADGRAIVEPTFIFGAADFARGAPRMYGGHGTLWSGPRGVMAAVEATLARLRPVRPPA